MKKRIANEKKDNGEAVSKRLKYQWKALNEKVERLEDRLNGSEKKADVIDGKLVEMKMVTEEKVKSLVTQDSFDCLGKTIQEVMSDVTNHLNKNSEAFDMMHQSSMEMASSAISQLRTSMENTGDTAAEEMVLLHQKVDEKYGAISELRIALKKMEVKIGAQVVSPFDGKTIAKDLEQTFMGKLEKMNTCLVECLDIRMDKFKKHFDDELVAMANHCDDLFLGMRGDRWNSPAHQKEISKTKLRKKPGGA